MMLSTEYKERIERQFCAFCMTVLHHAACNYFRTRSRQRQREISSDYLHEQWGFEPYITDKYFVKEDNPTAFMVIGQSVMVGSEKLANALLLISEQRREIILLSYYLRYSEVQIAALLNQPRTTVNYQKNAALKQLRKEMERLNDETNSIRSH